MIQDTIKQRLRASLLVSAPAKTVLDTAAHLAEELSDEGAWTDLDPTGDPPPGPARHGHLHRTILLARARHLAPGELDGPTRRAFDWWLSQDFRSLDPYRDQIVVPRLVGEVALLCDDDLSLGASGKVSEILARSRWAEWKKPDGWIDWTGGFLLGVAYNVILRACLEKSPAMCDTAFRRVFQSIRWTDSHGSAAHQAKSRQPADVSGQSVQVLAQDYARLITLAYGTPWQAPIDSVKSFVSYLLDFQQWTMRPSVPLPGRLEGIVSTGESNPQALAESVAQLAQLGNPPRRAELVALAERLSGKGTPLSGHRYVWRSQFAVHQRPDFYASIRLRGDAHDQHEVAPVSAPPVGGALYFLRNGLEYYGMAHRWDLRLLPGRTAIQREAIHAGTNGHFPKARPMVGGVSEGEYGIAALELTEEGLSGKKAWFCFDDSVVCLDAGLQGPPVIEPVYTSVNQCRLHGPVFAENTSGQRRALTLGETYDLSAFRRVEHDGLLYYFPGSLRINAKLEPPTDAEVSAVPGAEGVFTLWINHGPAPVGASSAYLVIPSDESAPSGGLGARAISEVQILANNPAVQAVRHRGSGLLGVVFWEPGVVSLPGGGRVAANRPCLLLSREGSAENPTLSISNLTRQPATVHVEYGGRCLAFDLPGGEDAGRSVSRLL